LVRSLFGLLLGLYLLLQKGALLFERALVGQNGCFLVFPVFLQLVDFFVLELVRRLVLFARFLAAALLFEHFFLALQILLLLVQNTNLLFEVLVVFSGFLVSLIEFSELLAVVF